MDEHRASHANIENTPVSKPLDEAAPQFRDEKAEHYNDCANSWVRGYDNAPHFDGGRLSGAKGNSHE